MSLSATALNDITSRVIGAAIEVHRALGPGLLEQAYGRCMAYELHRAGLEFEIERAVPLVYKGVRIDCAYRADFIVNAAVVVEIKAVDTTTPTHKRQLQTYVQLADCRVGLLLNFGARVMTSGITRVVNRFPEL